MSKKTFLNFQLLSVFAFGDVFADREVALVATLGDEVLVEGFEDGATWLVGVGAVAETTFFGNAENLREVVRNFVKLHIYHAKTFDARSVDEVRLFVDGIHLAEGGGVHTFVVIVRYLSCASVWVGYDLVDNSAFANARVAWEEGDFAIKEFVEVVDANTLCGRDLESVVTNWAIEIVHRLEVVELVVVEEVYLVENYSSRYVISLGSSKETVDECGGSGRIGNSYDKHALVEVGGNDVELFW